MPSEKRVLQLLNDALERIEQLENDRDEMRVEITVLGTSAPAGRPSPSPSAAKPTGEARWLQFVRWGKPCVVCGTMIPAGPADPPVWYDPAVRKMMCHACHAAKVAA